MMANFNAFVVSGLVVAAGMAVEFTAHLVAQFAVEEGEVHDRLSGALMAITTPILQGTASTFLAILPLAISPIPFFIQYSFLLTSLSLAVGWFNGMVILPSFLVTLATAEENLGLRKKHTEQLPTDSEHESAGKVPRQRRLSRDSRDSGDSISMTSATNTTSSDQAPREVDRYPAAHDVGAQGWTARTELTF